jgi:hypothetical protein
MDGLWVCRYPIDNLLAILGMGVEAQDPSAMGKPLQVIMAVRGKLVMNAVNSSVASMARRMQKQSDDERHFLDDQTPNLVKQLSL